MPAIQYPLPHHLPLLHYLYFVLEKKKKEKRKKKKKIDKYTWDGGIL
jgi:hypothetical protein